MSDSELKQQSGYIKYMVSLIFIYKMSFQHLIKNRAMSMKTINLKILRPILIIKFI
jgi:hypothetical protein